MYIVLASYCFSMLILCLLLVCSRCQSDGLIEQKTAAMYKNKSKTGKVILKGVAFPVCISVNECVCHCSPLESDTEVR